MQAVMYSAEVPRRVVYATCEKHYLFPQSQFYIQLVYKLHFLEREFFYLGLLHCKYIDCKYYNILLCLIYHRNLVVISTADGRIQPMIVPRTTIQWF